MQINVTQTLTHLDGAPLIDQAVVEQRLVDVVKDGAPVQVTLRMVCQRALMSTIPGLDDRADGKGKVELYALALRITKEDNPDLKDDDRVLLKERIGKWGGVLVVGQAFAMLSDP